MNAWYRIVDLFSSTNTIETIGWLLVHSLWQFMLIAVIAALLLRMLSRYSANTHYWILCLSFAVLALAPLATLAFVQPAVASRLSNQPIPNDIAVGPDDERPELPVPSQPLGQDAPANFADSPAIALPSVQISNHSSIRQSAFSRWLGLSVDLISPWLTSVVAVWCIGVSLFSLRPIISWINVRRLCRIGVSEPTQALTASMQKLTQRLRVRSSVRLLQSTFVEAPIVVGCFRCVILLPASLVANLPQSQLEAIIAHELSHVRRYDYLVNLLQTLIETLFFYHPAVWWLSNRIRIERENCCDDLVVANSISKLDYGKALLAIEESRNTASLLALSAKGGSLLARVQRMIAEPTRDTPRSGIGTVLCMLLALITTLMIWSSSGFGSSDDKKADSTAQSKSESPEYGFGPTSDGLQCRLIPVLSTTDPEHPDPSQVDRDFNQSTDVTFAVELKNVSDKPIDLAGIRYGDGYAPESQGKLQTTMFAPNWFSFTFTDASGKAVPRTTREFYDAWLMSDGASVHTLQPNETLVVALKPSEFMAPFNVDLPPGSYNATVHYHGPDDQTKDNVRKHWPEKPILKAWSHSVTSNPVAFTIEHPAEGARPEDLVWGPTVAGLQAAVEFKTAKGVKGNPHVAPGILTGSGYQSVVHVRNVSDKTITFISETARQGDSVTVTDAAGNNMVIPSAFFSGWPIDVLWTLLPGQEAELPILTPSTSIDKVGKYSVRYTLRFNSRQMKDGAGNITFPRPGDYKEDLETGLATLYLTDKLVEDSSNSQSNTSIATQPAEPYRLPDHWIVEDVKWINNDKELLTVSIQGGVNVRHWDVASRKLIGELKLQSDQHGRPVKQGTLRISRNGKRVIAVTDGYVGVWDSSTGKLLRQLPIPKKEWEYDTVRCLDCSVDGSRIVAGLGTTYDRLTRSHDGYGIVWDADSGKILQQFTHKRGFYFGDVAMSSDGKLCVTCSDQGNVPAMWDLITGQLVHDFFTPTNDWKSSNPDLISTNLVRSVALSPDNQTVAIGGTFGVRFFDRASGKLQRTIEGPYRYSSFHPRIVYSPDGKMLARFGTSPGEKGYVIPVWSTASGETLFELECDAASGSFSSDARLLATAESSFYEAVSVWPLSGDRNKRFASEPAPYERINCVEENTHVKGGTAKAFADQWKPQWGAPRDGVQYGIAFTEMKDEYYVGQRLLMAAFLRNNGDKSIQIDTKPDMFGNVSQITDSNGKKVELKKLDLLDSISHYRDTLQPGEIFGPLYFTVGLGENQHSDRAVWTPYWSNPVAGNFKASHQIVVHIADLQVKTDSSGSEWKHANVSSGMLDFKIGESQKR